MIRHASDMFNRDDKSPELTNHRKKSDFDDEKVMKELNAHDLQSWSETIIQFISAIYRTIKKYLSIASPSGSLHQTWTQYHQILIGLIQHSVTLNKTQSDVISQVFKSIEDFLETDDSFVCHKFLY